MRKTAILDHLPRLPIDRAFVMKGFGTVVTGTLLSGSFRAGQSLTLEPGGRAVRVRGMQTHGRAEDRALAGSRVALNLAGIEVSEVSRGQTLVAPETLTAVTSIDVEAWLLPGSSAIEAWRAGPLPRLYLQHAGKRITLWPWQVRSRCEQAGAD